jgi:IclR family acetate operon transcriptional repressor
MSTGARKPRAPGVKSALRVLDVLEVLAAARESLGISELSRRLGIPKSSASMLLQTLEGRGYVLDRGERRFTLHPSLASAQRSWVGGLRARLVHLAQPALARLAQSTGETALLALPSDARRIQYAAKAVSAKDLRVDVELDVPRAIHSTSAGLAILAHQPAEALEDYLAQGPLERMTRYTICDAGKLRRELEAVRRRGYAVLHQSHALDDSGVAAPVFDMGGAVVGALNVSGPTGRFTPVSARAAAKVVQEAAQLTGELAQRRVRENPQSVY